MLFAIFTAALGILMFVLGRWGSREAPGLVPHGLPAAERAKRERVYRRGAVVLQVVGGLFLVVIVVSLAAGLLSD